MACLIGIKQNQEAIGFRGRFRRWRAPWLTDRQPAWRPVRQEAARRCSDVPHPTDAFSAIADTGRCSCHGPVGSRTSQPSSLFPPVRRPPARRPPGSPEFDKPRSQLAWAKLEGGQLRRTPQPATSCWHDGLRDLIKLNEPSRAASWQATEEEIPSPRDSEESKARVLRGKAQRRPGPDRRDLALVGMSCTDPCTDLPWRVTASLRGPGGNDLCKAPANRCLRCSNGCVCNVSLRPRRGRGHDRRLGGVKHDCFRSLPLRVNANPGRLGSGHDSCCRWLGLGKQAIRGKQQREQHSANAQDV